MWALGAVMVASLSAAGQTAVPVDLLGCDVCAAGKREIGSMKALLAHAARHHANERGGGLEELAVNNTSTDLIKYDLDITIDPVATTISGSNTISFVALQAISTVQVRLAGGFTVNAATGVQVDGVNRTFSRAGITMTVQLGRTYNPGEPFTVKVTYSGVPNGGGFGSINFRTRGSGAREVWTLSETDFAHTWMPCKENNLDKCVADMRFTVPDTMKVASNGVLQSTLPASGNRLTYFWRTLYPTATYLYCFSATNHNEYNQTWNFTPSSGPSVSMPVTFWLYPESDTLTNRNAWFRCIEMLTAFSPEGRLGLYPFANEKYGMYQFGFGGGMEHQTATGQGTFSESVTAHELGHQWWGDNVTCATWNHIWLNEGFATYSEALWEEWKPGSAGAGSLRLAMVQRKPSDVNGTVWCPTTTDMNRIFSTNFSYRKGGWVLHMLRGVIGDAAFFAALRDYRAAYGGGSATTEEFQAICEGVVGHSLNTFFQQWVFQPGAPAYQFAWRNVSAGGQNYIELYLDQTQTNAYPRYVMPITTRFGPTGGGPTFDARVSNNADAEHFLIPVPVPMGGFTLDPDNWILFTGLTNMGTGPEGPPKVVQTSPAPGSTVAGGASGFGGPITVTFHKNVTISAGDVTLMGPGGVVPCAFVYDALTFTATLTPSVALATGSHTLGVAATVTGAAGGGVLDGETPGSSLVNPGSVLPSGDGLAGGVFAVDFSVAPPPVCVGDLTGDLTVNTADLTLFLGQFGSSVTPGTGGDFNGDGAVNVLDLTEFLGRFGLACP